MASRPELVEMCKELDINYEDMNIEDMTNVVREKADVLFSNKKMLISAENLSDTLRKFLTKEYDYVIEDVNKNKYDWRFKKEE